MNLRQLTYLLFTGRKIGSYIQVYFRAFSEPFAKHFTILISIKLSLLEI